jgi:hypothetical protein
MQPPSRPPIDTAVDLIERTALGGFAATGPNGRQALEMLSEMAFQLGTHTAATTTATGPP